MANSFNLTPAFSGTVESCLKTRGAYIQGKKVGTQYRRDSDGAIDFNYRRYAYFYLKSEKSGKKGDLDDTTSLFDTYPKAAITIGLAPSGGHLDLYEDADGVRRLKPQITSATINQDGGGDIYNSYLKEVEVQFVCYSLSQLENIEENFFRLGAEVKIYYGWLDPINAAETGEATMSVYNFGFSMAADGSYSCNIKGLIGDAFGGATRMGGLIKLGDGEEKALGEEESNPADISMALMAKYKTAFGLDSDEDASDSGIDNGEIEEKTDKSGKVELFMAGIMNVGESESVIPLMGDDPIRTPFTNLKSFVYLANQLSGGSDKETFKLSTDARYKKISPVKSTYGSADPRKYILPGVFADYGEDNDYESVLGSKPTEIGEILISINEITSIVKGKGSTVNDQFQPPKVVDILKDLSNRIANVTGGLVQLDVKPEGAAEDTTGVYVIQNKAEILKDQAKNTPSPFVFTTIGENSMVKDISIDTEFDADIMMFMTVGNVKNGNINLDALKTVYPNIPKIEVDEKTKEATEEAKSKKNPSKQSIGKDGVDDAKANGIAATLRKLIAGEPVDSPSVILPFQLKLGVTLDGVEGINFLAPVTADRLPARFRKNVKFLVTAVEHSFDGNGGWTTGLKTVMTMMK